VFLKRVIFFADTNNQKHQYPVVKDPCPKLKENFEEGILDPLEKLQWMAVHFLIYFDLSYDKLF
jgi:hypothetical protein